MSGVLQTSCRTRAPRRGPRVTENPRKDADFPTPTGRGAAYLWQKLQLSPGLKCFSDTEWHELQFIEAVCQDGFGGDVRWGAPSLWQRAQLGLVWTGTWQFLQ